MANDTVVGDRERGRARGEEGAVSKEGTMSMKEVIKSLIITYNE